MHARKGDRLVVPSQHAGCPARGAEVLGVLNQDGSPPYHVRWCDTGHEGFLLPGPGAYVEGTEPDQRPRDTEERPCPAQS